MSLVRVTVREYPELVIVPVVEVGMKLDSDVGSEIIPPLTSHFQIGLGFDGVF